MTISILACFDLWGRAQTLNQVNPLLGCLIFPLAHLLIQLAGHGHGLTTMVAKYSFWRRRSGAIKKHIKVKNEAIANAS